MAYHVRAVNRALDLLRCFSYDTPELVLAELASRANLSMSTAFRLLSTLEEARFVQHDPKTGHYRLGAVCIELGISALKQMDLWQAALPLMAHLRDEAGETISLTILDGDDVLYITVLQSPKPVRIAAQSGRRLPWHCTATGKTLLAFGPPEVAARLLSRDLKCYTQDTVCDPGLLRVEFQQIRERGFSVSTGQFEAGISAVAAPILNPWGEVVAALGIAGPSYRISTERLLELGTAVQAAADAISRQMGAKSVSGAASGDSALGTGSKTG